MSRFRGFAETAERIAATPRRLEKASTLGAYLATLSDADLRVAARFFAGYLFPPYDQRTTKVGGASLLAAIEAATGAVPDALRARLVETGDLGDAAAGFFAEPNAATLDLQSVLAAFTSLAETSATARKAQLLTQLLTAATPLEAKYLIKLLSGDLRIGLREGAVEDALARLHQTAVEPVAWANMLTGDIGETALLARAGTLASARLRLFHPIKFMLASPAATPDDVAKQMPAAFAVEDKYDGIRAQAHIGAGRAALFSRTLDDISGSFPDLLEPLSSLPGEVILDGEIVPGDGERALPFQALQKRLGRKKLSKQVLDSIPVVFMAFDILFLDSHLLLSAPFSERRSALESLAVLNPQGRVRRTPSRLFNGIADLDGEFDAARQRGNEGLMVKDPASPYRPGRRGRDWLKIKKALATLDVVVTAVEVGNGRRHHVLSDYTFAVRASEADPTLLNVGKAYSGLTNAEIAELSEWFSQHTLQEFWHGKVRLVEPRIVIEVAFDRVQPSNRHKSGYALRFPRIVRVRGDKPADQIDTLETVRRLAEMSTYPQARRP